MVVVSWFVTKHDAIGGGVGQSVTVLRFYKGSLPASSNLVHAVFLGLFRLIRWLFWKNKEVDVRSVI